MKERTEAFCTAFFARHPEFSGIREDILHAAELWTETFRNGGKLLVCGNGGSCSDCDHIAGELLKGFLLHRPTDSAFRTAMAQFGPDAAAAAGALQQGLPAISLCAHSAAITAFANDVDPALAFAQQVLAYGRPGDLLVGISTSGNAGNVASAIMTARASGVRTMALTGRDGGRLAGLAELALIAPEQETYRIQECHLAIYHLLCAYAESELFAS
jgi:D-sedoheptulose 7-phosphate isomerase